MYSVEIHTPITMNENFSVMCYLLVKSLAENAQFPGDWKIVFTVSLDSDLTVNSPQFQWAKDYPVEFQYVEKKLWDELGYIGTGTQCVTNEHQADVVLYIDADIVVMGSLAKVTEQIAKTNAVFGWPAWFSNDTPFNELFRAAGIKTDKNYKIKLLEDSADFNDPDWPPYFNFGFIGVGKDLANEMRQTFPIDQQFVMEHFENYFAGQVALALNIARNQYEYRVIDERYNVGSDHPVALAHYEKKLGRKMLPSAIANDDPRVLHYCFPTPTLRKKRDMASWGALRHFMNQPDLAGFELLLQQAIRKLDVFIVEDPYNEAYSNMALTKITALHEKRKKRYQVESARFEARLAEKKLAHELAMRKISQLEETVMVLKQNSNRAKALENSLSWRMTAPLRRIFDLFSGKRTKLH